MPVGTNLAALLVMLRAEARHSPNAAAGLNADATLRQTLARVQRSEWVEHGWRHLRVRRGVTTAAGSTTYAWPSDLAFDRVVYAFVQWGTEWIPLEHGISEADYNALAEGVEQDPPRRWDYREGNTLELWPTPASALTVRLWGYKALAPLVQDSDLADIDDDLLVLVAAAELLAQQKAPDAQAKQAAANRRRAALLGNASKNKIGSFLAGQRHTMTPGNRSRLDVVRGIGSVSWDGSGTWGE